ncbi:hypothetical protein D322_3880 [Yersinia enterocolitica IP 10393]|nr:hypothetical protein D322_3880 [Yersinia enterocolitica IP 10393]
MCLSWQTEKDNDETAVNPYAKSYPHSDLVVYLLPFWRYFSKI